MAKQHPEQQEGSKEAGEERPEEERRASPEIESRVRQTEIEEAFFLEGADKRSEHMVPVKRVEQHVARVSSLTGKQYEEDARRWWKDLEQAA